MKKIWIVACFMLLGVSGSLLAAPMTEKELEAQFLYIDAVSRKGSMEKIEVAEKAYNALIASDNSKINYKFRIASLTAVKAKHKWWPHEKMGFANEGVRLFDKVERKVKKSEDDILKYEFHLYRGRTYINFPGFLGKRDTAMKDFEIVATMSMTLDRPEEELGPFYLDYAKALDKDGKVDQTKKYAQLAIQNKLTDYELKEAKKLVKGK